MRNALLMPDTTACFAFVVLLLSSNGTITFGFVTGLFRKMGQ